MKIPEWLAVGIIIGLICLLLGWTMDPPVDASYPTQKLQHASYGDRIKVDRGRVHRIRFDQDHVTCYYSENWSNDAISLFCVQDK